MFLKQKEIDSLNSLSQTRKSSTLFLIFRSGVVILTRVCLDSTQNLNLRGERVWAVSAIWLVLCGVWGVGAPIKQINHQFGERTLNSILGFEEWYITAWNSITRVVLPSHQNDKIGLPALASKQQFWGQVGFSTSKDDYLIRCWHTAAVVGSDTALMNFLPTQEGRILIMQVFKKKKRTSPTLAVYSNHHLSAQQYTWHLRLLLFAIFLHDQH